MEQEIDLGKYVAILMRQWRIVIGLTLVCALIVAGASVAQPKVYEAQVLVAAIRTSTQVSLGTSIKTLTEDQLGYVASDREQRLNSFAQLVSSPDVAEAILNEIGDQLPAGERNVAALLSHVKGHVVARSDTIAVTVSHSNPQIAALLANSWGREYVRRVNLLYGASDAEPRLAMQKEIVKAKEELDRQEAVLEAYLIQDRRDALNRRLADYQSQAQALAVARRSLDHKAADYQTTTRILMESRRNMVPKLIAELERAEQLLGDAQDMRAQVQAGGSAAARSNEMALLALKAQVFVRSTEPGTVLGNSPADLAGASQGGGANALSSSLFSFQIQSGSTMSITVDEMATDLDSLVTTLQTRRDALGKELDSVAYSLLRGDELDYQGIDARQTPNADLSPRADAVNTQLEATLGVLDSQINALRAQVAQEENRLEEIKAQRSLALEIYNTWVRKDAEVAIAAQATGAQVRLAVPATPPTRHTSGWMKNTAMAAAAGAVLGVLVAFVVDVWRTRRTRSALATDSVA